LREIHYTPEELRQLFIILVESEEIGRRGEFEFLFDGYYSNEDVEKKRLYREPGLTFQENDAPFLRRLHVHPGRSIQSLGKEFGLVNNSWESYSFRRIFQDLYWTPLDIMPLWINRPLQCHFARWRLMLSK
jgi:hypothetical protein